MNTIVLCLFSVIPFNFIHANDDVPFFRNDYKYIKQDNAFYKKHKKPLSWFDAVAECESEGAELAWPLHDDEIGELKTLTATHEEFWIGIHALDAPPNDKIFSNLDGDLSNKLNNINKYTNVYIDDAEGKDCIYMQNMKFANDYCQNYKKFVCLAHTGSDPQDIAPNPIFRSDYILMKNMECLIKIHNESENWVDAMRACASEGSRLLDTVASNDLKELTGVVETSTTYWIGSRLYENEYNRQMAENNLNPGMVECVALDSNGKQQVTRCDKKYKFICQKTRLSSTKHQICRDGNNFLRHFSGQDS